LNNKEFLRKKTFRMMVVGLILSFIYDLFWLIMLWVEYNEDQLETTEYGKSEIEIK
jgi:hypothetical protein